MEASIVDLRYHMNDILKALDRHEEVKVFYHGKIKALLIPVHNEGKKSCGIENHPFFGMLKTEKMSVQKQMNKLRSGRYNDL